MGGFWRGFARFLPPAGQRPRRAPVAEKLAHLRAIGAANDAFLAALALYQEKLSGGTPLRLEAVSETYEALAAPVGVMVRALQAMGKGTYDEVAQRFEALDRNLAQEVLRARPIEFGPLVVWPTDPEASRTEVVGPKSARLAQLAGGGEYDVPPFFTVTSHGYRLFMEATGLQDLVEETQATSDVHDGAALRDFSERISAAILAAPLPALLEQALDGALAAASGWAEGEGAVAVRSSAIVEDDESSFAGQFESVLNVPVTGVSAAYRRVVASKYQPEALKYAFARGLLGEDLAMPVLVMAMVRPRASGVVYSRSPDGLRQATVTAVRGLAQTIADGRVVPDQYLVTEGDPPRVEEAVAGVQPLTLHCAANGGVVEVPGAGGARAPLALDEVEASRVARLAWTLERRFGGPQDAEWALGESGCLWVVQTRPLKAVPAAMPRPEGGKIPAGYRVLLRGGWRASGGVAAGPVLNLVDFVAVGDVPEGCVLVVPTTSPRLAGVMGTVAAVIAATGSATGHMATVAREFGVPCLVGAEGAAGRLADGQVVTLDADARVVYEGEVRELLGEGVRPLPPTRRDPVRESLTRLLELVAPLTLTSPDSPTFDAEHCRTLHDIARFVHQRAMAEMFAVERLTAAERHTCRRLLWPRPMMVFVLDLGGAVAPETGRSVALEDVNSVPLQALLEGMMDSRLRWAGPVGFDLKGFVSVVVRSAADDQRYGEPGYVLCSPEFVHFASRLAYHFALADAICGESVNENYVRFRFYGGAAVAQRREWRASFLATVLHHNGFLVTQTGDRVDAVLPKRTAAEIEDALVMLGRLMVASRHLDMIIESPAVANALVRAFLVGDYGFEQVRREIER